MASAEDTSNVFEPFSVRGSPFPLSVVRSFLLALRDLPTLSRYFGHLTLLALLLLVIWDVIPSDLQGPILPTELLALQPASEATGISDELAYYDYPASSGNTRYLEPGAVPFTTRAMHSILPIAVPQRTVRTTVLTYRVQENDTLLGIAQKFGLKGTSLLWANDALADNPDLLHVGQRLNILPVDGALHTVVKGDTIESIAAYYKVKPEVITSYPGNELSPPYALQPGQKLIIPGGTKPYIPKRVTVYEGPIPKDAKKGSGSFAWPMSGFISQKFWQGHQAIDIAAPQGTPIVAADSGFVAVVRFSNVSYGNMVIIDHGNGFQTLYAHFSVIYVEVGQSVGKGELLGLCGRTGKATGPHLHFEIIKDGIRRNPLAYLP